MKFLKKPSTFSFNFSRIAVFWKVLFVFGLGAGPVSNAMASDYHFVGWVNAFVPGGGQLLLGNYGLSAIQAVTEISTFGVGFAISARYPMTIDGVPEDYPGVTKTSIKKTRTTYVCPAGKLNPLTRKCSVAPVPEQSVTSSTAYSPDPQDLRRPVSAAFLQEVGLKYHMVNVFDSYRIAAKQQGKLDEGQGIDDREPLDFFKDPFRAENVFDPWVYVPLIGAAVLVGLDYGSSLRSSNGIQKLTPLTDEFVGFNQIVLYPFGSGAPEEMFYRGFIQNEARGLVDSGWFSIAASSLAFAFSHSPDGRLGAGLTGAYLGYLAHANHGRLGKGISLHFWSVFLLGIESFLLTMNTQRAPPATIGLSAPF